MILFLLGMLVGIYAGAGAYVLDIVRGFARRRGCSFAEAVRLLRSMLASYETRSQVEQKRPCSIEDVSEVA